MKAGAPVNLLKTAPTLRVGLVGPLPPPNGGMAMQTQQLVRLLESEGVIVDLVATNQPCRPAFFEGVRGLRALCRLLPFVFSLWRLAGRVDVIHLMANSGWSWQLYSAPVLWIAWLRATPVLVNYRGGAALDYFQRSFKRVRPSLKKAALIAVPSGYLQAVFTQFGETTLVIPNIVDRQIFQPRQAKQGGNFTLVITRNLEPIYGIDTAIRAFAQVYALDSTLRLRIAGSGPSQTSLMSLARQLGVEDVVSFVGRLDRPAIAALYAGADAMINPSTVDNMPNSVLEAMACGLPVISTNVGGVPFIARHGETALLVPPANEIALAQSIRQLRDDQALRQRLRRNGLTQVEQYTWDRVRHQWLDAYADLCSHKRRATV